MKTKTFDNGTTALHDIPDNYPHPIGWKMLVRLDLEIEKTKGGIIIPDIAKDDSLHLAVTGTVVAMGPQCFTREDMGGKPWCKLGDIIMFEKYSGRRFKVQEKGGKRELRILNDDDFEAIVNNSDDILPYLAT